MSQFFVTSQNKDFQVRMIERLNTLVNAIPKKSFGNPRSIGDTVEKLVADHFEHVIGEEICVAYSKDFSRRAMQDIAFNDPEGNYYAIDVKTHNLSTDFNMPNLTSVKRIAELYKTDTNYFCVLLIAYAIENSRFTFRNCEFVPIEHIDWGCLTIGALGWGQIQIANSNNLLINSNQTRKEWMLKLMDAIEKFYPKEIKKVKTRIRYFHSVRQAWQER